MKSKQEWFLNWFNRDYLHLYSHRNEEEAENQVSFLIDQLHLKGDEKILDLCCGAGRHSIAFAKRGFHVIGIDTSKELITEALRFLEQHPKLPVTFIQRDMRNLNELDPFDLVISMFTSFGYFQTREENAAVFEEVRKCLHKEGLFFLDFLHPYEVKQSVTPHEEEIVRGEVVKIDKEISNNRAIKTIHFPGRTYKESVALYSRQEIELMLQENLLQPIKVWNDYDANPWREDGERQLFLSKAV